MKHYVVVVVLTAVLTAALTWAVWRLSLRFKLYPGIRERDVHKTPTPRLGGVAMFLAAAAMILASSKIPYFSSFWTDPAPIWAILGATFLIVIVGVVDDLWDLDWFLKLGAQFLAAGIVVGFGRVQVYSLPIGGQTYLPSWVSFALSVLAIVVVMNAVNFIDGLDGLVAGVALIANGIFFAYTYLLVRDLGASIYANLASLIAVVLVGVCVGFLPFNWSPAKLFMGDAGALMLGLLMATAAIAVTGQLPPRVIGDDDQFGRSQLLGAFIPILLPLVVVLLPLLDFSMAVIRRMAKGKSPFSPDRKHLHHRMLDMGHTSRDAVLIFYSWTSIVSLSVLLMYIGTTARWPGLYWPGLLYFVVGGAACVVVTLLPSKPKPKPTSRAAHRPPLTPNPAVPAPVKEPSS